MRKFTIEFEAGALPTQKELATASFLANQRKKVLFLKPVDRNHIKTPDIIMDGLKWEMKGPEGKGKYLLQNTLHKAIKQSVNVIIDLRWIKISPEEKCISKLNKEFNLSKALKRLIIITRTEMLDLQK
ncbi:MAG: hypothetical protein LBK68_00460 [Candidatus Margulisbacteria bacterium]|nr:hypothetical protein [Candidatus Margulisiibacteriota bacterium]